MLIGGITDKENSVDVPPEVLINQRKRVFCMIAKDPFVVLVLIERGCDLEGVFQGVVDAFYNRKLLSL